MSFFRVCDRALNNQKIGKLRRMRHGGDAFMLWVLAGTWCSGEETDGFFPEDMLKNCNFTKKNAQLLCTVGLWEAVPNGYQFHNWAKYNYTRAQRDETRASTRDRVASWRDASREKAVRDAAVQGTTDETCNAVTAPLVTPPVLDPSPIPIPDPIPEREEEEKDGRRILRARAARTPPPPVGCVAPERERDSSPPPAPQAPPPAPPELPAQEPHEPVPEVATTILVRKKFSLRLSRASGSVLGYSEKIGKNVHSLALWVDEQAGGHTATEAGREAVLDKTLDGFFADEWAKGRNWPLGALVNAPGRYYTPVPGGGGGGTSPKTAKSVLAAAGAALREGRDNEAIELAKLADELAHEESERGRRGR